MLLNLVSSLNLYNSSSLFDLWEGVYLKVLSLEPYVVLKALSLAVVVTLSNSDLLLSYPDADFKLEEPSWEDFEEL